MRSEPLMLIEIPALDAETDRAGRAAAAACLALSLRDRQRNLPPSLHCQGAVRARALHTRPTWPALTRAGLAVVAASPCRSRTPSRAGWPLNGVGRSFRANPRATNGAHKHTRPEATACRRPVGCDKATYWLLTRNGKR